MNNPLPSVIPQSKMANEANVPEVPPHQERRIYEGAIQVEPWSVSESYKRSHNTLIEAARIIIMMLGLIVISFLTIPYRICRKSWTKPSKPTQPKLEKDLM